MVSVEGWPAAKYPDFCSGWVYVITPEVARKLSEAVDLAPFHFQDDLYITGVLRTVSGVNLDMLSSSWFLNSWMWTQVLNRS